MKTQQYNSNKQLKKWKILTGVLGGVAAAGVATSIALPFVLKVPTPTPEPCGDVIVSGSYKYETPTGEKGEPIKPDDYVVCDLEEINFYDMANWYANASTDTTVIGTMIAYDMVCIARLSGEYSCKYSSEVTYNFTQQRMSATIKTEVTEGGETTTTFGLELVNVPYWLTIFNQGEEGCLPIWTPIGSMDAGFVELWSFNDWSIKISAESTEYEINQDVYREDFEDMSIYVLGPCYEAFKDVKIKPFPTPI